MMLDVDPFAPCPYPPGSTGKLAWLAARFRLRLPLFVPGDAGDLDAPDKQQGPFARMKPTPVWKGLLYEREARQMVAEVLAGERDAAEVAALVGVTRRAVKVAAAYMKRMEARRRMQRTA